MTSTIPQTNAPIALGPCQGEALWAFDCLISVKASAETTDGRVTVLEHLAPRGAGSPLHVRHLDEEWFFVLEGELTFWIDGQVIEAPAGSFVYGPREVPFTFTVSSDQARFLFATVPGGYDGMLRALGEPAATFNIPPATTKPPDFDRITQVATDYGIEILGPPGIPA